jgi:AcrR family transcriptional regulator
MGVQRHFDGRTFVQGYQGGKDGPPPAPPRAADRGEARRRAFLEAARKIFLDQGFEAANVNDVVRIAGGSLATLYAQFGNKEGLFLAVALDQHERFVRSIMPECVDALPLEDGMQHIGERFLRALLDRENVAFFRIIVGEGRKFPELMQRYLALAAEKLRDMISNYIKVAAPECRHPERVGGYFFEMVRSRHHYLALSDDSYTMSNAEVSEHVRNVVRFLVGGINAL